MHISKSLAAILINDDYLGHINKLVDNYYTEYSITIF